MKTATTLDSGTGLANILAITVVSAFLASSTAFAGYVVGLLQPLNDTTTVSEQPVEDWRPDISKCPENVTLWNCIRNADYGRTT